MLCYRQPDLHVLLSLVDFSTFATTPFRLDGMPLQWGLGTAAAYYAVLLWPIVIPTFLVLATPQDNSRYFLSLAAFAHTLVFGLLTVIGILLTLAQLAVPR